tara:strand:- start:5609 stop:5758 length:150 start_codon:yes stop_codon:yes gene_type:complete
VGDWADPWNVNKIATARRITRMVSRMRDGREIFLRMSPIINQIEDNLGI